MKNCNSCFERKSFDEFHKHPECIDGRQSRCKKCQHKLLTEKRKDPSQREKFRQYQRRSGMKSRYGISPEIFDKMVISQNNKCLICSQEPVKNGVFQNRNLHIDHCHLTGKVRGLLCHLCNRGLGLFRERFDLIEKAAIYLKDHSSLSALLFP